MTWATRYVTVTFTKMGKTERKVTLGVGDQNQEVQVCTCYVTPFDKHMVMSSRKLHREESNSQLSILRCPFLISGGSGIWFIP